MFLECKRAKQKDRQRKGGYIKKLNLILNLFLFAALSGCDSNNRDETHVVRGETISWKANVEATFSETSGEASYFVEGNLNFKEDYTPNEVQYEFAYPSGASSGTVRERKQIRIPSSGGSQDFYADYDSVEEFAEEITLKVVWGNEEGQVMEEVIPLD